MKEPFSQWLDCTTNRNVGICHNCQSHLSTAVQIPLSYVGQESHQAEAEVFCHWEKLWAAGQKRESFNVNTPVN